MKFTFEVSLDHPDHIDNVQNIVVLMQNMIASFGPNYATESLTKYYKDNPIPEGGRHVIYESRPQDTDEVMVRAFVSAESVDTESTAAYAPEKYKATKDNLEFIVEKKP